MHEGALPERLSRSPEIDARPETAQLAAVAAALAALADGGA